MSKIKLTESQLREMVAQVIRESIEEGEIDEGFFNNLGTAGKTFFGKTGSLSDRWNAAKKNYRTQDEYDTLSDLRNKLMDLLDKRQINPNMTVGQLVGGKYNNNKFGTMSGMLGNRQAQMNNRMH